MLHSFTFVHRFTILLFLFFQIIVSSEGKNATTLIRIHIDPPPTTTRKPRTTTRRPTVATRNSSSKTRIPTLPRDLVNEEVEVFKTIPDTHDDDDEDSSKSDNLESENHQAFAFTVKENKARKYC